MTVYTGTPGGVKGEGTMPETPGKAFMDAVRATVERRAKSDAEQELIFRELAEDVTLARVALERIVELLEAGAGEDAPRWDPEASRRLADRVDQIETRRRRAREGGKPDPWKDAPSEHPRWAPEDSSDEASS